MNVLKYIQKNPKKSFAGMIFCGFVGKYFKGVFDDHDFRHTICREIMSQGTNVVNWQYKPKNITVFLNPAANNGKATKLFEKNAAPIFHLSGCNVKVIRLEYEGQAKQFMSVLDSTDVIVAAGGNGTVNEVITGLMRRPDYKAWANIPIGIIPLGDTNRIYYQLCADNCQNDSKSKQIMNATNDILKSQVKPVDVMKITGENDKSVYALSDLRWGSYSDAFGRTSKFWFWGPLKKYMTFVFASIKSKTQTSRQFQLEYCDPEPVSNSFVDEKPSKVLPTDPILQKVGNFLLWFLNFFRGINNHQMQLDNSNLNKEVSKIDFKNSKFFETLELTASINSFTKNEDFPGSAIIKVEHSAFSHIEFIKNGVKRFSEPEPQSINLNCSIDSNQFKITPKIASESWFKIDNEDYEAMPCTISIFPNKIKLIYS